MQSAPGEQDDVIQLAERAGLTADQLYFNIEKVRDTSSASIPLAIHDAVRDGVIAAPLRVFPPGFGAGAVAGYAVMRVDPAMVAVQRPGERRTGEVQPDMPVQPERAPGSEEMQTAFG